MFPFERILTYIADEQCALVIGPEIMHFEDKPMNMYLRDRLYASFKDLVTHYYEREGLFLFPMGDESVKSDVAKALKRECYRLPELDGYQEETFKTIARLPFHLIITINPDTFLSDTFYKFGIRHRFAHYRKGGRPNDEVAVPTREEPLVYNIAGSILEDESLILDYNDLFNLISSTLGAVGLPGGLHTALDNIRTYVFIGFPFEKWYTHIILRLLCGDDTYRKYAGPHHIQPDTHTFLLNQFKIEIWDPKSGDFWKAFLEAAEKFKFPDPQKANQPFLRELLEDPLAPEETAIIREIQNAQFSKAINSLLAYAAGTPFADEATQCSARYQTIAQNQSKLDSRDYLTSLNQITDSIITLARQIARSA